MHVCSRIKGEPWMGACCILQVQYKEQVATNGVKLKRCIRSLR